MESRVSERVPTKYCQRNIAHGTHRIHGRILDKARTPVPRFVWFGTVGAALRRDSNVRPSLWIERSYRGVKPLLQSEPLSRTIFSNPLSGQPEWPPCQAICGAAGILWWQHLLSQWVREGFSD